MSLLWTRKSNTIIYVIPLWHAGSRVAYHGFTIGFYMNELVRRVDAKRRSLSQYFEEEIATPFGE